MITGNLRSSTMTVTGAVSGASYTLTKSGNAALVVSNANNSLGGLVVNSGTLQAYNGGNVLGGASTPVNGMLGPWIANSNSASFVTYGAAGLTDVVYDATQANAWDANKKVNITGALTVTGNASVHAMKVGANVTVNSGALLSNASGGFILSAGNVLGGGTVAVGASELLAYVTGTRSFTPFIDGSGGLTLWGGGMLTLARGFVRASVPRVVAVLETLVTLGHARRLEDGRHTG